MSRITTLILFCLAVNTSFSQIGTQIISKNDWDKNNLKENVKSIKLTLKNMDKNTWYDEIITKYNPVFYSDYNQNNNYEPLFFQEFNDSGIMIKYSPAEILDIDQEIGKQNIFAYKIDSLDFLKKQQMVKDYNFPFAIDINNIYLYSDGKNHSKETFEYEYKIENQKIIEELYFNDYTSEEFTEDPEYVKKFDKKTLYFYNHLGQIFKSKIIITEDNYDTNSTMVFYDRAFGKKSGFDINYFYNENNRLIKITVYRNKEFIYQETYKIENNKIVEMEKLADSEETYNEFDTNKVVYKYDSFENPVNIIYYDNEVGEEIIHTIRFEYTFDNKNNWINCKMYIDAQTEKPVAVLERKIEYFKD